jgi:cell division transport system permease protein
MLAMNIYFAVLALAALIALQTAVTRWQGGAFTAITVELPAEANDAQVASAVEVVSAIPGVAAVTPMTPGEIGSLLAPWLGHDDLAQDLPLPRLIDVAHDPDVTIDWARAADRLEERVPGAVIDTGQEWITKLSDLARSMQGVAGGMLALVLAVTVIAVAFATRAGLTIHMTTIELLHLLGARDSYIANQFQAHAAGIATRGGLIGLVLALITILAIGYAAERLDSPLLPVFELPLAGWVAVILLPLGVTLIATITARLTVLRALERMP